MKQGAGITGVPRVSATTFQASILTYTRCVWISFGHRTAQTHSTAQCPETLTSRQADRIHTQPYYPPPNMPDARPSPCPDRRTKMLCVSLTRSFLFKIMGVIFGQVRPLSTAAT